MKFGADLQLIERALDAIEQREAKLLVWGIVDAFLTRDEMQALLLEILEESADLLDKDELTLDSAAVLLQALEGENLVTRVSGADGYRSRMAEALRLLARLRQLFPKHAKDDAWAVAPTLVSDFRFTWRRRRYPIRNIAVEDALESLGRIVQSPPLHGALAHHLRSFGVDYRFASFQIEAMERVLGGLERRAFEGTLVGAGTGSGKTLAFYIPALSWLAREVAQSDHQGVQILALYPRNELLKDQFAEVYGHCRRFDSFLSERGRRKLTIGVLYGDTPYTVNTIAKAWARMGDGFVCPYMGCPRPQCNGRLVAKEAALASRPLRLVCSECGGSVDDDEVLLTRDQLRDEPPDILFTTVEMMNQRIADSDMRHVFGIGPKARRVPRLVLLDEIHIYGGTYGAQVAYLLRRWKHLTKHRSSFVGLSATLANGSAFFSGITGLHESVVSEITPRIEDLTSEGAEYLVALRGDPVSRSSLLSTSIQTAMLATRVLDPRQKCDKRPFYGWRTFAFTDQVDAANRLFHDLRDAEGFDKRGIPNLRKHPNGGLAMLRTQGASTARYKAGQDWRLTEEIGHVLRTRHGVDRTTAADRGVSTEHPIIVATAALEVGYDDPQVGAVIQHKAPRDVAQFLQRKGRAGRTRHMRPWTIVVLSDYGRDRVAYQNYDQLFDPEVPARSLPLVNRYIKRIQAAYGLIDYLGVKTQLASPRGSVWRDLSAPSSFKVEAIREQLETIFNRVPETMSEQEWKSARSAAFQLGQSSRVYLGPLERSKWDPSNWLQSRFRRRLLTNALRKLLDDAREQDLFADFLKGALALDGGDVLPLLWEQPRPILLGAAPTALRRLVSNWRAHGQPGADYVGESPLPEYVPANLFSDLNLPEIRITRELHGGGVEELGYLPVLQGLDELAPGRVSKRYDVALWIGPSGPEDVEVDQRLEIDEFYELEQQPALQVRTASGAHDVTSFRPYSAKLRNVPRDLRETSNARLEWTTQLFARFPGAKLELPRNLRIASLLESITAQMHGAEAPAIVRRYALASVANPRKSGDKEDHIARYEFSHQGQPCALGFEINSDALVIALRIPESIARILAGTDQRILRALRIQRFYWEVRTSEIFSALVPNVFRRDWLAQIFLSAVCVTVFREKKPIQACIAEIGGGDRPEFLTGVLSGIFQSPYAEEDGEVDVEQTSDRLRADLQADLGNAEIVRALGELGHVLFDSIDDTWSPWLSVALKDTLGGAFLEAMQELCPEISVESLVVDTDAGVDPNRSADGPLDRNEVWISETSPGGNGLVEAFVDAYTREPEKFIALLEAALGPSEFERVDSQMRALIRAIGTSSPDEEMTQHVESVRRARGVGEIAAAHEALRHALVERGFTLFHAFTSCLGNRVLRSGTPSTVDTWLNNAMAVWDALESDSGVEVDARLAAYVLSEDANLDAMLQAAGFPVPTRDERLWRFNAVYGLLWSRGFMVRSSHLHFGNRYDRIPRVFERLLATPWLTPAREPIKFEDAAWRDRLTEELKTTGKCAVECRASDCAGLREVLAHACIDPIQLEYLNLYCRVSGVSRRNDATVIEFELPGSA